jgi:hypothetical protein
MASGRQLKIRVSVVRLCPWPPKGLFLWRSRAESELGADFDIRRFYDTVVGNGSLPIAVLEGIVVEWIAAQKN